MTPRQKAMLKKYDLKAWHGNRAASTIVLALRIKICSECQTCAGIGSIGGDKYPSPCPTCLADDIIDNEGRVIGRTSDKRGALLKQGGG